MKNEKINSKILNSNYLPTDEFYSQIIDSLQDYSIFTLDNEFIINSWSSGSTKIFGYESDEIIGEHFDVIFTEEDIQNGIPQTEIQAALIEGRATDNRWHICKDKSVFYAYGLVFPLIGVEGERLGYVKILRDLTERKKSEDAIKKYVKELEDLNAHKENVLAIVSHDLRSPLSGIIGTTEYLKTNLDRLETQKAKEMLDLLHKTAVDELNMLDNLVEWARIKYASEVFSPAKIKPSTYVQKVFESLRETASMNSINLRNEIEDDVSVFADGKMLLSVFQNIISNAIKHSLPGGEIIVSAKIEAQKVIIQIKDSGIGMSKEVQDKLFTPQMSTLSKARKDNKGAGIGLLLVKGFLEKNDGEIWVESVEGIGSSFYFTLPLEQPLYKIDSVDKIEFDERV
ncbi:two-component system CheB/CheR fusion protein [Flavobacterium sp. CG_23.5]|uniref:PAS domain-containing sensor histidine kinase n=1 Tax=unclassified Flavobacterium TaxID=196869 RepID=UPI0018CAB6B8|nr:MULTISPECIES: PAS domain-containing sensor histidine kinase [unclassified Flavobacterium]MBG6109683.1 two-component system CheB/CheR fusion protein [Flavobacterium sp. CG_9.10]MBP2284717.1 two-component system CheB/CheR fusion protein [Flavobacterium sp. CG_23.5]